MSGRALITGIAGQDGSLLAEFLLAAGYSVVGVDRPDAGPSSPNRRRFVPRAVRVVAVDLLDVAAVSQLVLDARPSEVYHLAASSFVPASWDDPIGIATFPPCSAAALLSAIVSVDPTIRFVQAATAAVFGEPCDSPQTEATPIAPTTPYGAAKAHAMFLVAAYRARHGLHAGSAILYNHESPRRPPRFVTRKITQAAAKIAAGLAETVELGDLDARRDWGYAGDTVRALALMPQAPEPADYIVATGRAFSVGEFAARAFARVGLDWHDHVRVDEQLLRGPADAPLLVGDATKARTALGWAPEVSFEQLVDLMVDADVELLASSSGA